MGSLEQRRRVPQHSHRFAEQLQSRLSAAREPGHAQRNPKRARRCKRARVDQLGLRQLAGALVLT
jgi:hypothetical protein